MKAKRKKNPLKRQIDKLVLSVVSLFLFTCFIIIQEKVNLVSAPESDQPVGFFETHSSHHIGSSLIQAVEKAKTSIDIAVYSITDRKLIEALNKKAEQGVRIKVIYDAENPSTIDKLGNKIQIIKRFDKGLMHLKLMVIDNIQTWIGSANFTYDSFYVNSNLMMVFEGKELADYVLKKMNSIQAYGQTLKPEPKTFIFQHQPLEFWFLPDAYGASTKIKQLIKEAKSTIKIAMFTFTREDFVNALIAAQNRGVKVEVAIDCKQSRCTGAPEALAKLKNHLIPVRIGDQKTLLHYKFMLIDDKILVNGSANWTKKAFNINEDCFVILNDLTVEQQNFMKNVWNSILKESQ